MNIYDACYLTDILCNRWYYWIVAPLLTIPKITILGNVQILALLPTIIYKGKAHLFTCRISVYDAPCVAFMILCKCAFLLFYAFIKCAFVIVCLWNCRPCAACCYLSYQMQCFQGPVCCVSDFVPLACLQMLALLPTLCWFGLVWFAALLSCLYLSFSCLPLQVLPTNVGWLLSCLDHCQRKAPGIKSRANK